MSHASVRAPRPRYYRAVLRGPRILDAIALAPDAGKASVDESLMTTLERTSVLDISADPPPPPPPVYADAHRARLAPLLALKDVLIRVLAPERRRARTGGARARAGAGRSAALAGRRWAMGRAELQMELQQAHPGHHAQHGLCAQLNDAWRGRTAPVRVPAAAGTRRARREREAGRAAVARGDGRVLAQRARADQVAHGRARRVSAEQVAGGVLARRAAARAEPEGRAHERDRGLVGGPRGPGARAARRGGCDRAAVAGRGGARAAEGAARAAGGEQRLVRARGVLDHGDIHSQTCSFLNDLERVTAVKYFPTDGTSAPRLRARARR
jgi:hypothetical protein